MRGAIKLGSNRRYQFFFFFALVAVSCLAYFTYWFGSFIVDSMVRVGRNADEPVSPLFWLTVAIAIVQPVMSVFGPLVGWLAWSMTDGERLIWAGFHVAYVPVSIAALFLSYVFR
jgi:hypothetical protein